MRMKLTDGEKLAKVLTYYGVLEEVTSSTEKIVCPFHDDVNPSMKIDFSTGEWFCFGCQSGGNASDFVKKAEMLEDDDINDLQALMIYEAILNNTAEGRKLHFKRKTKKQIKEQNKELYVMAYDYYHCLPKVDWDNTSIDEQRTVLSYMEGRGFYPKSLIYAGAKVTFSKQYQLIFPIMDNGKFKGYVCRTSDPEVAKKRKYLYNEGFRKSTTVVGDYDNKSPLFIVEGFMDRLKLIQNGVTNVVAIFGWKISDCQIKKIKDAGITSVISALDNDECGRKGTDYLRKHFKVTRFRYLKKYKDPGDFTKQDCDIMVQRTINDYCLKETA